MGVRVPGPPDSNGSFQYVDVGTNIDCNPWTLSDGTYDVDISVNRSSIYAPSQGDNEAEQIPADGRMVIRNFNTEFDLKTARWRDGRRAVCDRSSQWPHTEDQRDAARHKIDGGELQE